MPRDDLSLITASVELRRMCLGDQDVDKDQLESITQAYEQSEKTVEDGAVFKKKMRLLIRDARGIRKEREEVKKKKKIESEWSSNEIRSISQEDRLQQ